MKKLMIALSAAAAAIFAFGDLSPHGAGFEDGYAGGAFDSQLADDGVSTSGDRYWYSTSNDGNVISNYADGISIASTKVPDFFNGDYGSRYLFLDTSAPLFRTVNPNSHNPEFTAESIGEGIYLDTLVKFSAADSAFDKDLTDGDKIAIEYVECDTENDPNGVGYTNFVVRAGYIGSELVQTNYFVEVPAGFNKDDWHRLTVRTLPSIDAAGHVGFIVYLDQEALAYTGDAGDNFEATGVAQNFYTASIHAVYPSAVGSGDDKTTISAAAFSGTGAIDDVVFTATKPEFIALGELIPASITLGTGIASVTVTVGETEIQPVDSTATPLVYNLPAGTTSFSLAVTSDAANGYTFAGIDGATYTAGVVTWTGAAPTFTVLATRDGVSYIDDEDDVVTCAKLSEAFANAKDGSTITLVYDVDANAVEAAGFVGYEINDIDVTLDLNGKTITAVDSEGEALFTVNPGAKLTVIDSSSANTGTIDYATDYAVFYADGEVIVGAETGDYGPKIIGPLVDPDDESDVTVIRAKLDGEGNSTAGGEFGMDEYVDNDSEVSAALVNGYWVVAPAGEEPPATYAISWTLTGGTTTAAAGNFVEGAQIVFTADTGKTLSFVSIDGTEIADTSVYGASSYTYTVGAAAAELIVTFEQPAVTTYEVTITGAANATYTAKIGDESIETGDNVADGSVITIVATPDTDYEYAEAPTGWTLSEGSITKDFTVDGEALTITIPDATAKQVAPETWTVSVTLGDHVTSVSYCLTDDLTTTNTLSATGEFTIEKNKSFVFVDVTFDDATAYEIDFDATTNTLVGATVMIVDRVPVITPTADASGTIVAKSTSQDYPTYIPAGDEVAKAKYNAWKETYGADTQSAYEDAFLLNCAPAAVETEKAAFKLNITVVGDTVTVTTPDGKTYNGTVQLKGSNDLSTWTDVESASKTYQFYKAVLSL